MEESGLTISYPTLTRRAREMGLGGGTRERCERREDEPGREMQHDTSPYRVLFGGCTRNVTASLLYLRYSKRRYLRFYIGFTRFDMKCFFHEALMHWGFSAPACIIDNTNLARLSGVGKHARMAPEMEEFSRRYGFSFVCHELGHANRKAGEERSFWTVETNFLVGRTFTGLEDLNRQAFEWATVRMEQREQTKRRLMPAVVFQEEKARLVPVPSGLPAPYLTHQRLIDQYGYVAFASNYYWMPGDRRGDATILQYADSIALVEGREERCRYALPAEGTRGQFFKPEGSAGPAHAPRNRKRPAGEEEKRLRAMGPEVGAYLDGVLAAGGIARHEFMRKLFGLSRRMRAELFVRSVKRAHQYGVKGVDGIERIARIYLDPGESVREVEWDEGYREREAYLQGELTDAPDVPDAPDAAKDGEEESDGRDDEDDAQGAAVAGIA